MAENIRKISKTHFSLSTTGIAGPTGATAEKPLGLFYIGLAHKAGTHSQKHIFQGNREQNKRYAAEVALAWLREYLIMQT